jgi:hypothetical protein
MTHPDYSGLDVRKFEHNDGEEQIIWYPGEGNCVQQENVGCIAYGKINGCYNGQLRRYYCGLSINKTEKRMGYCQMEVVGRCDPLEPAPMHYYGGDPNSQTFDSRYPEKRVDDKWCRDFHNHDFYLDPKTYSENVSKYPYAGCAENSGTIFSGVDGDINYYQHCEIVNGTPKCVTDKYPYPGSLQVGPTPPLIKGDDGTWCQNVVTYGCADNSKMKYDQCRVDQFYTYRCTSENLNGKTRAYCAEKNAFHVICNGTFFKN